MTLKKLILPDSGSEDRVYGVDWNTLVDEIVAMQPAIPTTDEKAALVGTNGTPSSTNKYVTDSDPRNTNTRTPTTHEHDASEITSGTLNGNRLPEMSITKLGAVPPTGEPSGKYLKDDGTWAESSGNGDMTKAVYDTNDDGVVNAAVNADTVDTQHASDFAPASHVNDTGNPHSTSDANLVTTDVPTNDSSISKHGFLKKLSNVSTEYMNGQGNWATPSGGAGTPDRSYYRRTGATRERWYTVATTATAMTVSTALTANRIYAHPFIVPKTITLDRIAVNVTTLVASGQLRLGIYSDSNSEPNSLILDAGTVDTSTTGVKTITINQQLTAGLYWLVAASNSATHAFRVPAIASTINVCGVANTLPTGVMTHYYATFTYGTLPSTFPTVTEGTSLVYPAIFVRLSS